MEKFGVGPDKVIEVQALIGDSTDNVPGVPGIGPKTAAELIETYGDLETVLKRAGEIKQEKRRQSLIENAEAARISKKLVTLDSNVPLEVPSRSSRVQEPDYKNLIAFLKAMGFKTLTQRVVEKTGIDAAQIEAEARLRPHRRACGRRAEPAVKASLHLIRQRRVQPRSARPDRPSRSLPFRLPKSASRPCATPCSTPRYTATIASLAELKRWIARATETGVLAIKTETNTLDPMQASLCGLGLAVSPNEAVYVPLGHRDASDDEASGLFAAKLSAGQIGEREALDALKPLLEDSCVVKIGQTSSATALVLACRGIALGAADDVMLMSYVLDAGKGAHDARRAGDALFRPQPVALHRRQEQGQGACSRPRRRRSRARRPTLPEDADVTLRLWQALKPRMAAEHVDHRLRDAGAAAAAVLSRMERRGISIDRQVLARLSGEFGKEQARLEAGDQQDRRHAGQSRQAQAARRHPVRQARPARRHQDQDRRNGRPARARWKSLPSRATSCRARSSTGGRCRNCARPIPMRCRITSTRRRSACTRPTRSPRPRPGGCRRPSRICRTSRSAPRTAARSAGPSSPRRA